MDHSADLDGGGDQSGSAASTSRLNGGRAETANAWDSYDTVFLNAKAGLDFLSSVLCTAGLNRFNRSQSNCA